MPCSICKKSGHNKKSCKETVTQQPYTVETLPKDKWVCAACNLPLGNDHRTCVIGVYGFNIAKWEQGCRENGLKHLNTAN